MSKFTKKQSQAIKHMVLDCMITRQTNEETIEHIKEKLGYEIKYQSVAKIKMKMRQESKEYLHKLRSDNFEYHYEFLQRMDELRYLQRKAWELHDSTDSDLVKIYCIKEVGALTKSLSDLYDVAPLVTNTPEYVKSLVPEPSEDYSREGKET